MPRTELNVYDVAGAGDLTGSVLGIVQWYGGNAFTNKRGYNRVPPGGTLMLDNRNDLFTDDALGALTTIELRHGSTVLCRSAVSEYEYTQQRRAINITLRTPLAQSQTEIVNASTGSTISNMPFTIEELITATGVTITPETSWHSYRVGGGSLISSDLARFYSDLGIFADAYIYEDRFGNFRALNVDTDDRDAVLEIAPSHYQFEADSISSHLRSGWRRDAQQITYNDSVFHQDDHTFRHGNSLPSFRHVDDGRYRTHYLSSFRGSWNALSPPQEAESLFSHYVWTGAPNFRRPANSGNFVETRSVYINPSNPKEVVLTLEIPLGQSNTSWTNLQFQGDWYIGTVFFPVDFTVNTIDITARQDGMIEFGRLPPLPWPVAEDDIPLVQAKVEEKSEGSPRVTKLVFPINQRTLTQFSELAALECGSVVNLRVNTRGLQLSGRNAVMFKRWNFTPRRYSSLEMHFLELETLAHRRIRRNQRIIRRHGRTVVRG